MSVKYLLPCSCGLEVAVEPAQAGQKVQCTCGKQLDVPTMREIVQLEPFEASGAAARPPSVWGFRHGLLVFGVLLIVCSLASIAYISVKRPRPLRLDDLNVGQVWHVWEELRLGVDRPPMLDQQVYAEQMNSFYVLLSILVVIGVLGILSAAVALFLVKRSQSLRSTNTTSSVSPSTETGSSNR